jgi:hypothetical protein
MGVLANRVILISTKMQVPYKEVLHGPIVMIGGFAYYCAGLVAAWLKP